ncbi:MAG: hypothetical protein ABW321_20005 [Polyangiales bacterium]
MQARFPLVAIALCVGLACLGVAGSANAQDRRVEADFKGAVGLGLVGAELGAVIPALAGLDATWAYLVFPAVGAAGGALGGYFALDRTDKVELSVVALTAGMALVIPALIVTLSATAYDPGDTDTTGRAKPPGRWQAAGSRPRPASDTRLRHPAADGSGLLRLNEGELAFAAPGIALVPGVRSSGATRLSGVHVALLSGRF